MTKTLLEKYLDNRCTPQEVEEVIHWIKQEAFLNESKKLGKIDWDKYREEDSIVSDNTLNALLDKIHHEINIKERNGLRIKNNGVIGFISKAAAIILIPVLAFLFYTISDNSKLTNQVANLSVDSLEVIAPIGSRTVVELSDGTVAHLNYGSRIKYPQNFSGKTRSVRLIGEGYFEVAHNPDKPFVVSTGMIDVKAVGTVFNVNAYPENNEIATTLIDGKVILEKKLQGGKSKILGTMKPGQHVNYNTKTGKILSNFENAYKHIAWKDGKVVFDNEPIELIAQNLSRMFNVNIQVDKSVKKYKYTVTFVDEPLFQILEALTIATPIQYRALPRVKNADGTFSKQNIIIERK